MVATATLKAGMDFREYEYRREVFHRFYEFHLKYKSHPGAVYYLMPYLAERLGWDMEAKLWFAYLNGNTQNPVTSYMLFLRFPSLKDLNLDAMADWFHQDKVYLNLLWDTDRRYHKKSFLANIANYREKVAGRTQEEFFGELCSKTPEANFKPVWDVVSKEFLSFGRLSTFSYLEYLRIMGVNLDFDELFLSDMSGSKSHRNGLCKVLGRDDWDWHTSNPDFDGRYSNKALSYLEDEASTILAEAKERAVGSAWESDVSYFTLESALCTYKSWHRVNRRYPNVYNDLLYNRITSAQDRWLRPDLNIFWDAREASLPENLRQESNPQDVGCVPLKQNHYRLTGQVIMMERDWDCFQNDYADRHIKL